MPFGPRDWRIAGAVGLVSLLFYAGFTHARFKSTDEFGLYLMTESLFERATLEVPIHRHAHVGADGRLHAPFAIRAYKAGQIDTWLWKLARGWPGEPARPVIALALVLCWIAGSAGGALALWRATGRAP